MSEKIRMIKFSGTPPELLLLTWSQTEIECGELLSREEMAEIGAIALVSYIIDACENSNLMTELKKVTELMRKKTGAPPSSIPVFNKELLRRLMKKNK